MIALTFLSVKFFFIFFLKRKGIIEKPMSSYIFESVECANDIPIKAFVTGIKSSSFHWHYEYELLTVLKGELTIQYGSKVSCMKEGDVILVNARTIHSIFSDTSNMVMVVQLGEELFRNLKDKNSFFTFYLDSVQNSIPPKCDYSLINAQMAKIVQGCQTLENERCKNKVSPYRIRAEIYTLVADLVDYVEHDIDFKKDGNYSKLQDAINYIDYMKENLQNFDVLNDLCEHFKISRKTLDRSMSDALDLSSKDMLEILRTDRAKQLLSSTEKSPAFIIDECGFGSEKTFYRIFKEQTGITPREYREKGQQEVYKNIGNQLRSYLHVESDESEKLIQKFLDNLQNS